MFDGESTAGADVHLPAETHAEKEGTVTHPDGRLQRVRPSVPHPGAMRPLWQALTELSAKLGDETGAGTAGEVFDLLARSSELYDGLDYDRIGGTGLRWQEVNPVAPAGGSADPAPVPGRRELPAGSLRLGTYHDLWADYVAERNPSLEYPPPGQTLELSEATARELGFGNGTEVLVSGDDGGDAAGPGRHPPADAGRHRLPDRGNERRGREPARRRARDHRRRGAAAGAEEAPALGVSAREKVEW